MLTFSTPQMKVMCHGESDATSIFAGGAVRSGKSWSVGLVLHAR